MYEGAKALIAGVEDEHERRFLEFAFTTAVLSQEHRVGEGELEACLALLREMYKARSFMVELLEGRGEQFEWKIP